MLAWELLGEVTVCWELLGEVTVSWELLGEVFARHFSLQDFDKFYGCYVCYV